MIQPFRTFAVAWASATFFHQAADGAWIAGPSDIVLTLVAAAVLLRPSSPGLLLTLAAVQLVDLWVEMPYVSNHWLLTGFVNLLLLLVAVSRLRDFGAATAAGARGQVLRTGAVGPVRASVLALYFWAAFHKLNTGYLDPQVSCGRDLVRRIFPEAGGAALDGLAIYGSLALEIALPVLLIVPATRGLAFLLGGTFHIFLGWVPLQMYANFSSVLLACYFFFLPRVVQDSKGGSPWWPPTWLGAVLVAAFAGLELAPLSTEARTLGLRLLWTTWGLAHLGVLLVAWRRRCERGGAAESVRSSAPGAGWRRALPWLAPALIFVNGLVPYLGGKTELAFAMYSNLRIEEPGNHLLLGKLTGRWQDDLLEIEESTDPVLDGVARRGYRLSRFQLASYLADRGHGTTRVRYREESFTLRPGDAPPPFRPPPYLARKLLYFRPVPPGANAPCSH